MPTVKFGNTAFDYDRDPDECPLCHHGIEPKLLAPHAIQKDKGFDVLQLVMRCPRHKCQRAFIATYTQELDDYRDPTGPFLLRGCAPYRPKEPDVPEEIVTLSPAYAEILKQSHTAEHFGLTQICGVGYRKALEFLVKDFVIYKNPDKEKQIKETFLGTCISDFVDDSNIKECASRAAWLGNDETHYVRIWEDKDIEDLKVLIKLTEAWIQNNLLTEKYLESMENKSKGRNTP